MFVSIVLNTEYMDYSSRKMWYLKNLLHCKENGWILITHDYIRKHFNELQDSITDRFFEQFEMRRFTLEEMNDVEQYFIPDEIFDDIENEFGSRTEMLFHFFNEDDTRLKKCLEDILIRIKKKHPNEKIDGIIHCLESYQTIRNFARYLDVPLINYSFSAFRKPHGYRQTLYQANTNGYYWGTEDCEKLFKKFKDKYTNVLPLFTNKEILAIIGKERNLPILNLIDASPKYEIGICCECYSLVPKVFQDNLYLDDDIFYECNKYYDKSDIKVRSHAAHLDQLQISRNNVHNDPASTILSCKRVTAVQSQILLKALLWNRSVIMKKKTLPFAAFCNSDYKSDEKIDNFILNFYIFCYLIPSDLMFSDDYWRWRLSSPSEDEIYMKHLLFILDKLGIDTIVLKLDSNKRLEFILNSRSCDNQLICDILSGNIPNIDWNVVSSRIEIQNSYNEKKVFWRINKLDRTSGNLTTTLDLENVIDVRKIKIYPLDDIEGYSCLLTCKVNGVEYGTKYINELLFMPKQSGCYTINIGDIDFGKLRIEFMWNYLLKK